MRHTLALGFSIAVLLSGCSALTPRGDFSQAAITGAPLQFEIGGKVGVRYLQNAQTRNDSAFFQWNQQDGNFNLQISGALGLGATQIYGSESSAVLVNSNTRIEADSASELLLKASGWQAPLESMTYWIVGQNAPGNQASTNQFDEMGRMTQTKSGAWMATLSYQDQERLPSLIRAKEDQSVNQVVLSIKTR